MSSLNVNRDELDGIISYFYSMRKSLDSSLDAIKRKAGVEAALNIYSSLIYIAGVEDGDPPLRDFRDDARAYVRHAKAIREQAKSAEKIKNDFDKIIKTLESVDKLVDNFESIPVYLPGQGVGRGSSYSAAKGIFFASMKEELSNAYVNNGKVTKSDILGAVVTGLGASNAYLGKDVEESKLYKIAELSTNANWSQGILSAVLDSTDIDEIMTVVDAAAYGPGLKLVGSMIGNNETTIDDEDVPLGEKPNFFDYVNALTEFGHTMLNETGAMVVTTGVLGGIPAVDMLDKFTERAIEDVWGNSLEFAHRFKSYSSEAIKKDEKQLEESEKETGAANGDKVVSATGLIGEAMLGTLISAGKEAADIIEAKSSTSQNTQTNTNTNPNTNPNTNSNPKSGNNSNSNKSGSSSSKQAAQTQQPAAQAQQPAQQSQPAQQTQQPAQQTQQPVQNNPEPQQPASQQQETVQREIVRNTGDVRPKPSPTPKPSVPDPTPVVKTEPSQGSEAATSLGDILDEALGDNKEAKVGLAATVAGAGAVMGGKVDVVSSLPDVSGIELPSTTGMDIPTATTSTIGQANVQSGSSSEFINSLSDTSTPAGTTGSGNGMNSTSGDGKVYNNNTFADSLEKSTQEANSQNQTNSNKSSNNTTNLASENKDEETKKFGKSKNNSYGSSPDDENQDDDEKKLSKQHQEAPEDENEDDKKEEKTTKEKKNKAETIGGASGYLMPADETVAQVAVGVTVGGAIISALLKALKIINWIAFILLILALILLYTTYRFTHKKIIEKRKKQYLISLEKINKEQDNMVDVSDAIAESTVASTGTTVVQNSDNVNEQQASVEPTVTVDSSNTVGSGENIEQGNTEENTEEPRQDLIIPPMKDNPNYEEFGTGLDFMQPDEEQQVDRQN